MEDEHNRTKQKQELCKWSSEKKFCAAHGLHFKNIPGCCRPNLNMNLFWSISLKKKKRKLTRSVRRFKGNDFLKIYPQDQTTKTVSEWHISSGELQGITSPCNRMQVCGIWESVNGKKIPNMLLLLRWKEQFSLICSLCSLNGQKSTKCAKGYFIH